MAVLNCNRAPQQQKTICDINFSSSKPKTLIFYTKSLLSANCMF